MNRINIITLGVRDITQSLRFYRDGLGFRTLIKEDDPAIVFLIMPVRNLLCIL